MNEYTKTPEEFEEEELAAWAKALTEDQRSMAYCIHMDEIAEREIREWLKLKREHYAKLGIDTSAVTDEQIAAMVWDFAAIIECSYIGVANEAISYVLLGYVESDK